jgi:hypothetical protein
MRTRWILPAALLAAAAFAARAAEGTHLSDESGDLQIDAPGTWRTIEGKYAIAASGFVGGVKRTELFAVFYAGAADADAAARKWKEARTAETPAVTFTAWNGDPVRWIAADSAKRTVDYCRALAGAGKAAVVWARMTGEPGVADADAFALLDAAKLGKSAAAAAADAKGAGETQVVKDKDFTLAFTVPKAMQERKDIEPPRPRLVLSLKGPVGTDVEAFLDVYALPEFDRTDAAGWWWIESERRGAGWQEKGVRITGDPPSFLVLPNGETWSRHVRILPTKAGVYALKLDIESAADKAGDAWLDDLVEGRSLAVLRPRADPPVAPPGTTKIDNDAWAVFHETDPEGADAIAKDALWSDAAAGRVLGLEPFEGRKGTLRVTKDQAALDAVIRPLGGPPGRAAWWSVRTREVYTRAGVLANDKTRGEFLCETARDSIRRRFGFRPPFWVEHGVAHLVESGAYNKGRIDQIDPPLAESAHNSVGGNIEFETVRWWTEEDSAGNPEREAIAWGLWLMFTEEGQVAQKWAEPLKAYVAKLRQTGSPVEATKLYPFERDADLVEDFKKRMKKLER